MLPRAYGLLVLLLSRTYVLIQRSCGERILHLSPSYTTPQSPQAPQISSSPQLQLHEESENISLNASVYLG